MPEVTQILSRIEAGDPSAAEQLLPLLYDEFRKLAAGRLAQEKPGQTLQPTALVHEAYLRLIDGQRSQHWNSRGHFFGAVAEAMRRILVDNARRKHSLRQGGNMQRHQADFDQLGAIESSEEILAIDEALAKLAQENPAVAKLVELKFFAGLTLEESAQALDISVRTANRYWTYAKAYLYHAVRGEPQN
jgi:RNA polymerase sigma factor (TIGR02999 family)